MNYSYWNLRVDLFQTIVNKLKNEAIDNIIFLLPTKKNQCGIILAKIIVFVQCKYSIRYISSKTNM